MTIKKQLEELIADMDGFIDHTSAVAKAHQEDVSKDMLFYYSGLSLGFEMLKEDLERILNG